MVLLGVISDTHDNLVLARRANRVFRDRKVDYVIHLGDFVAPFTFKAVFEGFEGKGYGVFGNNDGEAAILLKFANEMDIVLKPHPYVIELKDKRILVSHGFGSPENTLDIVRSLQISGRYDLVLYGHTHQRNLEKTSGTLLLNPGEAGGVITGEPTIAIVDLDKMEAEFVELKI